MENLFKEKKINSGKVTASPKVIFGIIGKCWESPSRNKDIAEFLDVKPQTISKVVNYVLESPKGIGVIEKFYSNKQGATVITINFEGIFDYLTFYSKQEFSEEEKQEILTIIKQHRKRVGKRFLDSFIHPDAFNTMRGFYKLFPEFVFLQILNLDVEGQKENLFSQFLIHLSNQIFNDMNRKDPKFAQVMENMLKPIAQVIFPTLNENKIVIDVKSTNSTDILKAKEIFAKDNYKKILDTFFWTFVKESGFRHMIDYIVTNPTHSFVLLSYDFERKKLKRLFRGKEARKVMEIYDKSISNNKSSNIKT